MSLHGRACWALPVWSGPKTQKSYNLFLAGAMAMQLSFSQFSEAAQSQGGPSCSQRLTCAFSSGCRLGTPVPAPLDLTLTDSEGQDPLRDATNMEAPPLSQLTSQQLLR